MFAKPVHGNGLSARAGCFGDDDEEEEEEEEEAAVAESSAREKGPVPVNMLKRLEAPGPPCSQSKRGALSDTVLFSKRV